VPGALVDEWDEDGDLELTKKLEVYKSHNNVLVKAQEITESVWEIDFKPQIVMVNYNNMGYCRMRFDEYSLNELIPNLKYVKSTSIRTYFWRTFKDMIRNN